MQEKEYKKNNTVGIICDIVGLFIFGYIFSWIAYFKFNDNYKMSLGDKSKKNKAIVGKLVSSFIFGESISYHGLKSQNLDSNEILLGSTLAGLAYTLAMLVYIIIIDNKNYKDKKSTKEESKVNDKKTLICENCGEQVSDDAEFCPNCGSEFEEDSKNNKEDRKLKNEASEDFSYKCSNCGEQVSDDAEFCPNCGEKFEDIEDEKTNEDFILKCSNCGEQVSDDAEFCPNCGEKFEDNEEKRKNVNSKRKYYKNNKNKKLNNKYNNLRKIKELLDEGVLTQEEFEQEKEKILNSK